MNERTRALALQAGFDIGRDWQVIGMNESALKDYTKLVVRECLGIYDKIDNGNQHLGTDDYPRAVLRHFDT